MLIGRVGKDPEVGHLESGTVANFSIATTKKYKDKAGQPKEQTEWHRITAWGKLAEIIEKWVKKGMLVYVEGELRTRSYDDKQGIKHYVTEVYASELQMLSRVDAVNNAASEELKDQTPDPNDTNLPF